ncbi:MAG: UvrD-helicase domain-containing protein [Actinobacteria bacterium]|nr:UvrD-helicase domain-containing protein [Actinomycetota bacterium]
MAGETQRAAAIDDTARVRVVAGPGTGKSFTIEQRVCWLLEQEVETGAIAAVSFTRASALDLQTRVHAACAAAGQDGADIRVTTLHSLALRSLRKRGVLGGYPVDPVVLDRWELENLFDDEFGHLAGIGVTRRREIREDHEAFWSTGSHEPRPSPRTRRILRLRKRSESASRTFMGLGPSSTPASCLASWSSVAWR